VKNKSIETNYCIDRQAEIYEKALDLFIIKGYDATSMSMIAKALGMSKPNLYYYCPSKEDLLYRIHLSHLEKRFIPILDSTEKLLDPKDRISHFLRNFTLMCTSSPASRVLVHEVYKLKKEHREEILSIYARAYGIFRYAIRELQQSGEIPKFRDSFLTFMWTGMTFWIVYWFDYSRQDNAEELAEIIVKTFERSMLGKISI
jgi:AcrR family transcriptional regulator